MLTLLPMPRRLLYTGGECASPSALQRPAAKHDPHAVTQPQGYELYIDRNAVRIVAHDAAGAFYAQQTLAQILAQCQGKKEVPCLRIIDWPDFPNRGVMLDISRDKVPTLATLKGLVDLLSSWKINQLQLYMEHTFAYPGHEPAWKNASPITAEEIRDLDAYCRERFVELVPNQNSFGHMHRWLKLPEYRHLAETPDGVKHPWADGVGEPFSLCPTDPKSIEFVAGLFDSLLPNFTSKQVNVGCDETFDIGLGRSADACAKLGKGRVYLDFLKRIHELTTKHGRRMQFWADIIHEHPELVAEVPKDAIAMEWGYWEFHPFEQRCKRLADSGLSFYVCPGTSTWSSVVGNTTNAVNNIRAAAHLGQRAGAIGLLNTDWGDNGHHQPLPVSYLGYACGAAMSWAYFANQTLDLAAALDKFAFRDSAYMLGRLAWQLGETYRHACGSPLFGLMQHVKEPRSSKKFERVTVEGLEAAKSHVLCTIAALRLAQPQTPDAQLLIEEFRYAAALIHHLCNLGLARWTHNGEHVADLPARVRKELADELAPIIQAHRQTWLARNREGGLADSAARLRAVMDCY